MRDAELNLSTLAKYFQDEDEAYQLIESLRWPDGPICPHCGTIGHAYLLQPKEGARKTKTGKVTFRRLWKCGACRKQFSVLVGTIFSDSKVPLSKWLLAIHLLCAGKNGVAAFELHRQLGVTAKTAWFMAHRIRYAMQRGDFSQLTGTVEADETYIGGAAKNMHAADRERKIHGSGGVDKTPVFTLVQRDGQVRSQVVRNVTGRTLGKILREEVDASAAIMTDTASVYRQVHHDFASHETVNHQAGEYVRGEAYTNTVEGYFSQLKRSIDGTHHHVSERHLHRYLSEFDFRYNTRKLKDGERTAEAIRQTTGKRLRYS